MAHAATPNSFAAVAVPHLDDGVVSEILHRLPSKDAYRLAAVCGRWRAVLSLPTFLCRHLCPRPLPVLDDGPCAFIVQPRDKVRYTHLTLVATDPNGHVAVKLPVPDKYKDHPLPAPPPRSIVRIPRPHPVPTRLETARDKSVCRPDDSEDDGAEPMVIGSLFDDSDDDAVPTEHPAPPRPPPVEDYVVFFESTVPTLDVCIVASHGRLLLARTRSRYYVCDPSANRWIVLPPSTISPVCDANAGIHYEVDASTGMTAFTVVLILRRRLRRGLVETFSSRTGEWDARELRAEGVARCLGAASPGVRVGTSFYWQNRRSSRVIRYDAARDRASVFREPPLAEKAVARLGRSLGSVDGTGIRLCAFDIRDEKSKCMMPHDDLEGVHGVWFMEDAHPWWRRVHEAVVEDLSVWYFLSLWGKEKPVDFPGASGDFIVLDVEGKLLRYDLESGNKVQLFSLYRETSRLGELYRRFHAFPFFG
uniref:Uncharacterized protein n=1 Tax=Avena sativa TaxID=4498 RepID=A0ACD5X1H0_AVESA